MRENERHRQDTDREIFDGLIGVLRQQNDSGIVAFESNLEEVQTYLTDEYVNSETPFNHVDVADVEQDLRNEWHHTGNIARLSGRLYINDFGDEDAVRRLLGDGGVDEEGRPCFMVEDLSLRSVGIDVVPTFDATGKATDIRIAYTFSMLDDEEGVSTFKAYTSDLYEHVYEKPTLQQAIELLEQNWPHQFLFLREWVHFEGKTSLPARLGYVTKELQKELSESEEFYRLVECYVAEVVSLDQTRPYNLIAVKEIDYSESDTPHAEWSKLSIKGQLHEYGYSPEIKFIKEKDATVRAAIIFAIFNDEDNEQTEYVRLDVNNIRSLKSTRAVGSLAARAMSGGGKDELLETLTEETFSELSLVRFDESNETSDDEQQDIEEEAEALISVPPEKIQNLMRFEEIFSYIMQRAEVRSAQHYRTYDEAHAAAMDFTRDEIPFLLRELAAMSNIHVTVAGTTIGQPQAFEKIVKVNKHKKGLLFQRDEDEPIRNMQAGDNVKGVLETIRPRVTAHSGIAGGAPSFTAGAGLVVQLAKSRYPLIQQDDIELASVTVDRRVIVPLDGSNEVQFTSLEAYREAQKAVHELSQAHPDLEATQLIELLNEEIKNEEADYKQFSRPDLMKALKKERIDDQSTEEAFKYVTKAIEALLIGRTLKLSGDFFYKKKKGKYGKIKSVGDKLETGTVVDVRTDIKDGEIFLSFNIGQDLEDHKSVAYVRARSISALQF